MGLFGYNEKDYRKNTEVFKGQLSNLQQNLFLRGIRSPEAGQMISKLIITMDQFDFPKGKNSKDQDAIDKRMADIISKMEADAVSKDTPKLILHANMLLEAIDNRGLGIQTKTAQDYAKEEIMTDLLGQIQLINKNKLARQKRKEEIMREADRLEALGMEENPDLEIEFNNLTMDDESDDMLLHSYREQYNQNYEILKREKQSTHFEKLANGNFDVMTDQALDKMLNKMAENVSKHADKINTRRESLGDFKKNYANTMGNQSSSNSFAAEREARKAQAAASNINNANYNAPTVNNNNSENNNTFNNKMN